MAACVHYRLPVRRGDDASAHFGVPAVGGVAAEPFGPGVSVTHTASTPRATAATGNPHGRQLTPPPPAARA